MKLNEKALGAAIIEGSNMAGERLVTQIVTAYLEALGPGSTGEREDPDGMPFGEDFLAENRFGDWLTVRRFDPKKPGDYSGNAVINGRTGRWWHPQRWRPLPEPPSAMLSAAGGATE